MSEPSDNTNIKPQIKFITIPSATLEQDQLYDSDKTRYYQNLQNFYNNNFWGNQTNFDPRIPQGQAAIQSNFDYLKNNVQNFAEQLATAGVVEGVGQAIKWATTPVVIGEGAEAVVTSAPLSTKVTKVSLIPRSEMHLRNQIPATVKSDYVGKTKGLETYNQRKIKIIPREQLSKAYSQLEKLMSKKGWSKITHPNLQGIGFTNGRYVVSDLGAGNVGRDFFGRPRLIDFAIESVPEFRLAMQKQGGKFKRLFLK